ncbi:putative small GTPase [Flagelloscypha sp. PMI_526]|nr:putative small GTPase [Flagelloscypha sp. PMI_526]
MHGQTQNVFVIGDSRVGKTSLISSFHSGQLTDPASGRRRNLHLRFLDSVSLDQCYRQTDIILLCFSIVDERAYARIRDVWVPSIMRRTPGTPIILVGTKLDLALDESVVEHLRQRRRAPIQHHQAQSLAQSIRDTRYFECSVTTGEGIEELLSATAVLSNLRVMRVLRKSSSCSLQ